MSDGGIQPAVVAFADSLSAPLIAADVDQDADEPRLFIRHSAGNGFGRSGSLEERFLNEVEGVIDSRRQTPGEPIEPLFVPIEERRQSRRVLCLHTSLNA